MDANAACTPTDGRDRENETTTWGTRTPTLNSLDIIRLQPKPPYSWVRANAEDRTSHQITGPRAAVFFLPFKTNVHRAAIQEAKR